MDNNSIKYESDDKGVVTLTLNRPEVHNAFDDQLIASFSELLDKISKSSKTRVVVLKAEGKSFSAGADLKWMQKMIDYDEKENMQDAYKLSNLLHQLNTLNKPTIAEIQGSAFGGGVGLIACCDIAIAAEPAQFGFTEVKLGLIPAVISPFVLHAIGERMTRRYFLTGERFSSEAAYTMGLIHEVVPIYDLHDRTNSIIKEILHNGPQAISSAKSLIQAFQQIDIDNSVRAETSQLIAKMRVSDEGQEGLRAFLKKRKPNWV